MYPYSYSARGYTLFPTYAVSAKVNSESKAVGGKEAKLTGCAIGDLGALLKVVRVVLAS
jgi:hypothetical protein